MAYLKIAAMQLSFPETLLIIFFILYFFTFFFISLGWNQLSEIPLTTPLQPISVSILIAARNEADTLPLVLNDLLHQSYPPEWFDIIIIDDHSDRSIAGLDAITTFPANNLKIIELQGNKQGKKAALLEGAKQSTAELLLFTDADCRVPPDWIRVMVNYYQHSLAELLIGLVDYTSNPGFIGNFYRADLLSLVVSGAGTAKLGIPTLCNGANLAVKRTRYYGLSEMLNIKIPSGDDIFLLHALKKLDRKAITVVKDKRSVVLTNPPKRIIDFFNQRTRWASKSFKYTDMATISLAILVYLTNTALLVALLLKISGSLSWFIFSVLVAIKILADCLILAAGLWFFGNKKIVFLIPFYEVLYSFYAIVTPLPGIMNLYNWKGRNSKLYNLY